MSEEVFAQNWLMQTQLRSCCPSAVESGSSFQSRLHGDEGPAQCSCRSKAQSNSSKFGSRTLARTWLLAVKIPQHTTTSHAGAKWCLGIVSPPRMKGHARFTLWFSWHVGGPMPKQPWQVATWLRQQEVTGQVLRSLDEAGRQSWEKSCVV